MIRIMNPSDYLSEEVCPHCHCALELRRNYCCRLEMYDRDAVEISDPMLTSHHSMTYETHERRTFSMCFSSDVSHNEAIRRAKEIAYAHPDGILRVLDHTLERSFTDPYADYEVKLEVEMKVEREMETIGGSPSLGSDSIDEEDTTDQ